MSKFSVGQRVRPITPGVHFDKIGRVIGINAGLKYPVDVAFSDGEQMPYTEHELTLADPDVHTVLDQMDAESAPEPNRRAQVLRTAESLVNGDRAKEYGEPGENYGRLAALLSAQFSAKLKEPLTASDAVLAMVHLKLSRLANTPGHEDSWIDACGYLALGAEIAEGL